MNQNCRSFVPIAAAAIMLAVCLTAYIAGYFAATDGVGTLPPTGEQVRVFNYEWQAQLFAPAAKVESVFAGREVNPEWVRTPE